MSNIDSADINMVQQEESTDNPDFSAWERISLFISSGDESHSINNPGIEHFSGNRPSEKEDTQNQHLLHSSIYIPKNSLRPDSKAKSRTKRLAAWEGIVKDIRNEEFVADLYEIGLSVPIMSAIIPFDEISTDQQDFIVEGASFYWFIYYKDSFTGRKNTSLIIFNSPPVLTPKLHQQSFEEASRKYDKIATKQQASKT
jgi:hypothetical protein